MLRAMLRCLLAVLLQVLVATATGETARRFAFVTIATDDYYAKGALVTLHSARLHSRPPRGSPEDVDFVLMVPASSSSISRPSEKWLRRFETLGIRVVTVPEVIPSPAVLAAMEKDRAHLASQGILEVLQPIAYGGAFAKIHAWDRELFGSYEKVVLLDGDIVAKKSIRRLLTLEPLAASRDLMDAFNYGVLVLRPDAKIHAQLQQLLTSASAADVERYSTRKRGQAGICDQTLVAGYLAAHHGPVHFFEDLRKSSREHPQSWMLSTEFNLVVSYRSKERCEEPKEAKRVEAARLVHFANNWLHFDALARDRESPGRIDSPRCYRGAFRYWHDLYHHALMLADANTSEGETELPAVPKYSTASAEEGEASPERVQEVFLDFQSRSWARDSEEL